MFLIEALLGILIFSLGILSLVAMQTAAVSAQSDARYRIEAANLADQIVSDIWLNISRPTFPPATAPQVATELASKLASQASVLAFQHQPGGSPATCDFTGAASASPLVAAWVNAVAGAGTGLPGATAARQQITVNPVADPSGPAYSMVTVTVCWQAPIDLSPHRHTVVALIGY